MNYISSLDLTYNNKYIKNSSIKIEMQKGYNKKNTFSRTPSPAQIISYLVIGLQTGIFYGMLMNSFNSQEARITLIVLYSCSVVALFVTTFLCSFMDPSDETMVACRNGERNKFSNRLTQLLYCDYCDSYVEINSRHCRQCDRCVENFDHHCIWINNCVGNKNYCIFIAMIISTCSNMLIFLSAVIVLSVENQWEDFLGFMITSWTVSVIIFVLAILLVNLIILHIYLICKGYTTYQFIIARREDERQKQLKKTAEQAQKRQQARKNKISSMKNIHENRVRDSMNEEVIQQQAGTMSEQHSNFHSNQKITPSKTKPFNQSNTKQQTNQYKKYNEKQQQLQKTQNALKINDNSSEEKIRCQKQYKVNQFVEGHDNIFGQSDSKSDAISLKLDPIIEEQSKDISSNVNSKQRGKANINNKKCNIIRKQTDQYAENTDQDNEQVRMSQFFTRNKSLSFLIGKQLASKPKRRKDLNMSAYVRNVQTSDKNDNNRSQLLTSDILHTKNASISLSNPPVRNKNQKSSFALNNDISKNKKTNQAKQKDGMHK